jgi:hypothetical protein
MQIQYSFDKVTLKKIGKGLLISMSGAAALAGLNYIQTIQIDNPLIATLVVILVPSLVNTVKEYIKGEEL